MQTKPFKIFSWKLPFLPALKNYIDELTDNNPLSALVIVPHNRPWRYFLDLYIRDGKTGGVPKMLSFSDMVSKWRFSREPTVQAGILDQVFLLYQVVKTLANQNEKLAAKFAAMEIGEFLPWGFRLAGLLEEMFNEYYQPRKLDHLEMEVGEHAAALLSSLDLIANQWRQILDEKNLMTPGYSSFLAATHKDVIPPLLFPKENRPVIIAGFYSLNGVQEKIFKSLYENGAHICLHSDADIVNSSSPHWAVSEHIKWINSWKADVELVQQSIPETDTGYSFFSGYDAHSQIKEMAATLKDNSDLNASTAIVLANSSLLMPVLHHLPDKNVNISMGYPLGRSTFNSFLQELFELQNMRNKNGEYYWKNVLRVINHPFIGIVGSENPDLNYMLRNKMREINNFILEENHKYVDIDSFFIRAQYTLEDKFKKILEDCRLYFIKNFENLDTPKKLGLTLEKLCMFLAEQGGDKWHSFPLDSEAISRIYHNILPLLKNTLMAETEFSPELLQGVIHEMISLERTPFEADPIVGVQVMGLLETRLLQFDRVMIIDATDDNLPGNPPQNPLLPDSLRSLLYLPDSRSREHNLGYYLSELCAGAKEAHFFWQDGVPQSGIFEGKKTRSRYIERLIWEEEQKRHKLLKAGEGPLFSANALVCLQKPEKKSVNRTPNIDRAIQEFLKTSISPTRLDIYLSCPYSFAQKYLLGIREADEVFEGEDSALIGECIHNTLYNFYKNFLDKASPGPEHANMLIDEFYKVFNAENMIDRLPIDSAILLQVCAPERLRKYIKNQPEKTTVVAVEKNLSTTLDIFNERFSFLGRIDRLDKRNGKLHLLDYKTGKLKKYDSGLWSDQEFFLTLEEFSTNEKLMAEKGNDYLLNLRERLPSIQLPCYIMMLKELEVGEIGNAALVDLHDSGKEINLFDEKALENIDQTVKNCEIAVAFLLTHMKRAMEFSAEEGKACKYCPYSQLCLG